MAKKLMLSGNRFGRLLVLCEAPRVKGKIAWKCQCDCGRVHVAITDNLRSGATKSCGCLKHQKSDRPPRRAPYIRHPLYQTWLSMRTRCNNPNSVSFPWYGGRGITVCERWDSFKNFLSDMGPRPNGHTLERVDRNKDYSPENCIWASRFDQARNTRANQMIEIDGVSRCAVDWEAISGIKAATISSRIKKGWSAQEAVFKPLQSGPSGESRRLIACFGETLSITEWALRTGISRSAITFRLNSGWPAEDALSLPARVCRRA